MSNIAKKLDVVSLALELQSLESETFEIQDYAEVGNMLTGVVTAAPGSTTSSTSTCSSTTSTTSCTA